MEFPVGPVKYRHEYPAQERLRVGYLGCGGHSYRNILPCFQYLPAELVAVCDRDEERATAFREQFGAQRHFCDYEAMLGECALDAVVIVAGYADSRITHAPRTIEALDAGCHVFVEKPPANSVAEVQQVQAAEGRSGKFAMVGYKKAFFPTIVRAREISCRDEFGPISSIYARYPQRLPLSVEGRRDPAAMLSFLDHLVHPASILLYLGGPMVSVRFAIDPAGGSVSTIRFASGAIGNLHLVGGPSGTSPLERLEIVGNGANVVVDNGVRLTYYRQGGRGEGGYGRAASFIGADDSGPVVWEPEFSLGQLYNKNLFMLGYAPELLYFCECVRSGNPPAIANTDWSLQLMQLYEAYTKEEDLTIPLGAG